MLPERLEFLNRFDAFYKVLTEQVKVKTINEADFYMLLGVKCKNMNKERRERKVINNKIQRPKK